MMKYITLIIGLFVVLSLLTGCADDKVQEKPALEVDDPLPTDTEILEDLDNTVIEDFEIDVGEMY